MVVPTTYEETLERALGKIGDPYLIVERAGVHELLEVDLAALDGSVSGSDRIVGYLPACRLEHLGDRAFCAAHRLRYPYVSGAMANGIGSVEIVEAMGRAGMLGIFGAAGLPPATVEAAIDRLGRSLGPRGHARLQPDPQPERAGPGRGGRRRSTCGAGSGWSRRRRIST